MKNIYTNMNLIIITSVIHTSNTPLSYSNIRSIYTSEERFQQTQMSITSIKNNIPNYFIILLEGSKITESEEELLKMDVDLYLNYSDELQEIINGSLKSYAEGCIILQFLESIEFNNLPLKIIDCTLFKLSGRYFLNESFNFNQYNNNFNNFKQIEPIYGYYTNTPCYYSQFYKITATSLIEYINILKENVIKLKILNVESEHTDMEHFLCTYFKNNIKFITNKLGVSGNTAINGEFLNY